MLYPTEIIELNFSHSMIIEILFNNLSNVLRHNPITNSNLQASPPRTLQQLLNGDPMARKINLRK
jgi:hypothetical protein